MSGVVERRLLINYRVDPTIAASMLPAPFEPQVVNGWAVAGICLIRLGHLRPRFIPARLGLTSENAAHRFAVKWRDATGPRTGVYIPIRHSGSGMNVAVGDRLFPGRHERADFEVIETDDSIAVAFATRDSLCPSKKDGGDLNFFPRAGAMVEPFAKTAFELKPYQMSDVVATEFGYHLILVTARKAGTPKKFEEVKEDVKLLYAMKLREAVLAQMKPKAKIDINPAPAAAVGLPSTPPAPVIPSAPGVPTTPPLGGLPKM